VTCLAVELGPFRQTVQHDEVAKRGALAAKLSLPRARRMGADPGVTHTLPGPLLVTGLDPALAATAARGDTQAVAALVAWFDATVAFDVANGVRRLYLARRRRPGSLGLFSGIRLRHPLLVSRVVFVGAGVVARVPHKGLGAVATFRPVVMGYWVGLFAIWAAPGGAEAIGLPVTARPLGEGTARRADGVVLPAVLRFDRRLRVQPLVEDAQYVRDSHAWCSTGGSVSSKLRLAAGLEPTTTLQALAYDKPPRSICFQRFSQFSEISCYAITNALYI
jgi:hypothetical protein